MPVELHARPSEIHGRIARRVAAWTGLALAALLVELFLEIAAWCGTPLPRVPERTLLPIVVGAFAASVLVAVLFWLRPALVGIGRVLERLETAEEERHRAEERYRDIVENAVEGIFQTSPDGAYITANPALASIYGYGSPADLVASVTDVERQLYVEPRRRLEFVRGLQECDQVSAFESRIFRKDGSMIWISENARAVRDSDGRLLHYEGTVIDITERKRAEAELRTSESELRRHRDHLEDMVAERTVRVLRANDALEREIVERRRAETDLRLRDRAIASISEGISITDPSRPDNPLVYVNSGFERLTGYRSVEVLGRNCRLLQGPATDPAAVDTLRAALAEARECVVELVNYRKDGSPFWNLLSITPVRNEDGALVSFIGVQFDITERKRVEELKDDLVSTVSHELRTPLASLRGFTELLLHREFPRERQQEFLGIVHGESLRLSRLIDNFLDLQRMEAGRQTYAFASIDLVALLQDAVSLFRLQSERHRLYLEIATPLPRVRADGDRIRQVMANLLSNAVKFSPDGGEVRIAVSCGGEEVSVAVSDEGIGMDAADASGLFRKFHRLEGAEERGIGGTGLGLALVREIVEAHGGRVGVTSERGLGSTFRFTLVPATERHAEAASPAA
jgi:PAS domain S-box-containing protein